MIQGSRQLLMVYERLRASAIKWEHSKGPIPYGMSVLKDKGMLSWFKLCCCVEPESTREQLVRENIPSGNDLKGGFSVQLKDILVEMALRKIRKDYGLCHI